MSSELENKTSLDLVDELNRILDRLGGEELSSLPGESLGDDIKELLRIGNRTDAAGSGVDAWSRMGPPIPAETARRIACDCSITPVLRGAESHQVEAGRTSRVIPPSMRRALIARDRGCRFPGCDRQPAWTDGHHLKHWADGGPTLPDNLALLCHPHLATLKRGRSSPAKPGRGYPRVMAGVCHPHLATLKRGRSSPAKPGRGC
jgi:hypothetical protein